jgi:hypothetical protein
LHFRYLTPYSSQRKDVLLTLPLKVDVRQRDETELAQSSEHDRVRPQPSFKLRLFDIRILT